jgi:hypothetical protein
MQWLNENCFIILAWTCILIFEVQVTRSKLASLHFLFLPKLDHFLVLVCYNRLNSVIPNAKQKIFDHKNFVLLQNSR